MHTKYSVGEQIGKGATCTVYEGRNRKTGERVAIKAIDSRVKRHLHLAINEIRVLRRLGHPNVVRLVETIETDTQTLLVLEKCKFSLSSVVKQGALSHKVVVRLFRDLLVGLRYLHSHGIIHRDIKLGNVMISEANELKIIDFGLSKDTVFSAPKTFCGTPDFISPEILDRKPYTKKTDMYSAGMLVYFLVFRCDYSPTKLLNAKQSAQYRDLACLLEKLLEANPDRRISAEEALVDKLFHSFLPQALSIGGINEFELQTKLGRLAYTSEQVRFTSPQCAFVIRTGTSGVYQENVSTQQDVYTPFSAVDSKTLKLVGFCYSVLGLVKKRTPVVIVLTERGKFFKMMKEGVYVYITDERYTLCQHGKLASKCLKTKEPVPPTADEREEIQQLMVETIRILGNQEPAAKPITVDKRRHQKGQLKQSLYQSVGMPSLEPATLATLGPSLSLKDYRTSRELLASQELRPVFTDSGCILRVAPYVFVLYLLCGECLILEVDQQTLTRHAPHREKELHQITRSTNPLILQKLLLFAPALGASQPLLYRQ